MPELEIVRTFLVNPDKWVVAGNIISGEIRIGDRMAHPNGQSFEITGLEYLDVNIGSGIAYPAFILDLSSVILKRLDNENEWNGVRVAIENTTNGGANQVVCDRCGENVFRRSMEIENLYKYDTTSKKAYIESLMRLENVSEDIATSWAEHGLYEQCAEKVMDCPSCGNQLKTWQAKLCIKCGTKIRS